MTAVIPANPQKIYKAWLNSKEHTAMSGSKATASAKIKGKFTAWDGYISGHNLELQDGKKIVQAWRSTEFPEGAPDSILEIKLDKKPGGKTQLTLTHSHIPQGQAKSYKQGWKDYYFVPMKQYFSGKI